MKTRNTWFLVASPLLSALLIYGLTKSRDTSVITSIVGTFPTQSAKQRAAILRLSQDMEKHPEANIFRVNETFAKNDVDLIVSYVRKGKDNEVVVGPNKEILTYTYTRSGQKYMMQSASFPEKAIHLTAKSYGDIKTLHQIVWSLNKQ